MTASHNHISWAPLPLLGISWAPHPCVLLQLKPKQTRGPSTPPPSSRRWPVQWRTQYITTILQNMTSGEPRTAPLSFRRWPVENPVNHYYPLEDQWRTQYTTTILQKMTRAQHQQTAQKHQWSAAGCFQLLEFPSVTSQTMEGCGHPCCFSNFCCITSLIQWTSHHCF